jgi:hypothetical protein
MNRRRLRFADYAAVLADAETLVSGGYQRVGNWSLGQMAIHLAIIAEGTQRVPLVFTLAVRSADPLVCFARCLTWRTDQNAITRPSIRTTAGRRRRPHGVERLRTALVALDAPRQPIFSASGVRIISPRSVASTNDLAL